MGKLLETKWGRLISFFLLYLTEGIPLGLTATAIAFEMRKRGVGIAQVGAFVATLYLPWSWKFLAGPVVDLVYIRGLGRRRGWILICQVIMAATLLIAMPINFATKFGLFTTIILLHNVFAATQDVAIDALAVSVFSDRERGLANGMMFAGAYTGNGIGGAGILYLAPIVGFNYSFIFTASAILLVTLLITLRLREPPRQPTEQHASAGDIVREFRSYINGLVRAMFGSRQAVLIFVFALLPAGAYSIGLVIRPALAVELGFKETSIANLSLAGMLFSAGGCVLGGMLSDRLGRKRMLATYVVLTTVPTLWFAWWMQRHGWISPIDPKATAKPIAPQALVIGFWAAVLGFAFMQGLMYGTRTALFMDLCIPALAATQFTVYMSLLNLGMSYSAALAGLAIKKFGYPTTLVLDAAFGCACLLMLPLVRRPPEQIPVAQRVPAERGVLEYEAP